MLHPPPLLALPFAPPCHADGAQAAGLRTINAGGETIDQVGAAALKGGSNSNAASAEQAAAINEMGGLSAAEIAEMKETLKKAEKVMKEQKEAVEKLDQDLEAQGKGQ